MIVNTGIYENVLADKWKYITSTYKNQRIINSKSFDAVHKLHVLKLYIQQRFMTIHKSPLIHQ